MKSANSTYYWFTLFALCFIAYRYLADNIRPNYNGNSSTIKYLLGVAPNFFPAIGIPALLVVIISQTKPNSEWINRNRHITANLISVTGLITWEFVQATSTKLYFDWNDIVWTLIGAAVFHLVWVITPDRYKA